MRNSGEKKESERAGRGRRVTKSRGRGMSKLAEFRRLHLRDASESRHKMFGFAH